MPTSLRRPRLWIVALIVLGGVLPLVLYWWTVGRASTLMPEDARKLLTAAVSMRPDIPGRPLLVDVRTPGEYNTSHLDSAVNWPLADIESLPSAVPVPAEFRDRTLLLICSAGIRSARAALILRQRPEYAADKVDTVVYSVRGGLQEWASLPGPSCPVGMALVSATSPATSATVSPLPMRVAPAYEQWAAVLTAFGVKPLYMLLALGLIVWLWKQPSADLVALRWGVISFLAGESFCAMNYLLYRESSYLLEHLHSYGMVLTFGFTVWAIMEGLDARVLRFSHATAPCAWIPLCQRCIKHTDVPCGLRRLFLFVFLPATMIVAALPLCMDFRYQAYTTTILGSSYGYLHAVAHQYFEIRYLPTAAIVCALASLVVMIVRERHPLPIAKVLFAAALGAMGFAYFRLLLLAPFADNQVWFVSWEEITELLYILGVGGILFLFRASLLAGAPVEARRVSV